MAEVRTKSTFGGATLSHVSPTPTDAVQQALNVHVSFEKALKLHLPLGQVLGRINTYNRSTAAGKAAAVNLCVYPHRLRVTVNEGKLRKAAKSEPTGTGVSD